MKETKTFSIRLSKPLLAQIEKRAIADKRSVNNLITKILAEWVESDDRAHSR